MPIFIKIETIKKEFIGNQNLKKKFVNEHKLWVKKLKKAGLNIKSGFLVNETKQPGAGGLLTIEANTYQDALGIIKEDPMIRNKIVDWKLSEWIEISQIY